MQTVGIYKSAEQVKKYFEEHLAKGDYYTENDRVEGRWVGKTTTALGLKEFQKIEKAEFEALADGYHPITGEKLAIRIKKDRIVGYDLVFSAPKTVSIMALTFEDTRLLEAHEKATLVAFREAERQALAYVRKGGKTGNRPTENLIAAQFTHTSSRELDPQLHTHHLAFNFTFDPHEKRIKALNAFLNFKGTKFVSEVYRNALAHEVRSLGYEIEQGKKTWRIKDVPAEVEKLFSKRSEQIKKRAKQLEAETGLQVDNRGLALISLKTRSSKNKEIQEDELVVLQRKQLSKDELTQLEQLKQLAVNRSLGRENVEAEQERIATLIPTGTADASPPPNSPNSPMYISPPKEFTQDDLAKLAIRYAFEHVFERKSVIHKNDVLCEALKFSAGRVKFEFLEAELKSPRFIHRGHYVMTREERRRELSLLQSVRDGKRMFDDLGFTDRLPRYISEDKWGSLSEDERQKHLSPERWKAAETILQSRDRFTYLRGAAGAGKTSTLSHVFKAANVPNIAITAPTSGAAEKLREEGFSAAVTTQKLLMNEREQKHLKNALIVVDEAGLLSTRQLKALFELAEKKEARVLLVGDTRQHNSVEAGDALRLIEDYSVVKRAELGTIIRQKSGSYRDAIQALSRGSVQDGFQILQKMGVIHQADKNHRPSRVAEEYAGKLKQGIDTIVVTPTWDEHREITDAVRETLKREGIVSEKETSLQIFKSANFTSVEKRYAPNLTKGLYLSFHANKENFKQGDILEIVESDERTITVEDGRGNNRTIKPKDYASAYDVVEREERKFAKGDKILMKANYATSPANRIPNGAIRTIEKIEPDGTIRLNGGKHLEKSFRMFTHGYAVTSPASQGKDAKHVIISANANAPGALSTNQFYVSASRGKESVSIYTSNIEKFRKSVSRSAARELALENLVRNGPLRGKLERLKVNAERSVEMTRDLIERAFVKFRNEKRSKENTLQRSRSNRDQTVDRDL